MTDINPKVYEIAEKAERKCEAVFKEIDNTAFENSVRVINAFREEKVSESCFAGTTGYGYDDVGRETLERIYCRIFHTESALVRLNFVNGTHALSAALYSLLKPGDKLLSVSGLPYDTLQATIGVNDCRHGSLKFYGIGFGCIDLLPDGGFNYAEISEALTDKTISAITIQRSRGYGVRRALTVEEIGEVCSFIKKHRPDIAILVDNCYGEFTQTIEPTDVGADLIAGSLIKNPGGGLAPCGGYIAGKKNLVDNAACNLTTPGIGGECGATLNVNRLFFQGLFEAPHVVAQALKTAVFCAAVMEELGFGTSPASDAVRSDIIQVVELGSAEKMKQFCKGIQSGSPVDSYVTPEPWPMPGYSCDVIMAAGTFVQGASIELSADGPIRPPYCVYLQGGLTYESGKIGVMSAVSSMLD